jgi:hypothetical protein
MKISLFAVIVLLFCGNAFAGGSLPGKDVEKILQRDPKLWEFLSKTMDFSDTAWGVRCGKHWPLMGGARIAPYSIDVTPKGTKGAPFTLTVECEQRFFDKDNKEIPLENGEITDDIILRAARVEEKPLCVKLFSNSEE